MNNLFQFGRVLLHYSRLWSTIASLAAVALLWLFATTDDYRFVALAIAEALLALFCLGLRAKAPTLPAEEAAPVLVRVNGRDIDLTR